MRLICTTIICVCLSIVLYSPATHYSSEECSLVQLRQEMEAISTGMDDMATTLHETLYLLELHRLSDYLDIVAKVREAHRINDGYTNEQIVLALDKAYNRYGLARLGMSEYEWFSQCYVESRFNAHAVSHMGAIGIAQIMPDTAKWLNSKYLHVADYSTDKLYDVYINAELGALYMSILVREYRDVGIAMEVYNKGPRGKDKTDYQLLVSRAYSKYFIGR